MKSNPKRRLAAIVFTDMVGFTDANQEDESLALELLEEQQEIVRSKSTTYNGKEVKTIGDAFLLVFESAVDALHFSYELQSSIHERNQILPPERILSLRIAIHVDDIVETENDAYGNGVNIAARVQNLAPHGGIALTEAAVAHLRNKVEIQFKRIGSKKFKGIHNPVLLHRAVFPWDASETLNLMPTPLLPLFTRIKPLLKKIRPVLPNAIGFTLALISSLLLFSYFNTAEQVYKFLYKSWDTNFQSPSSRTISSWQSNWEYWIPPSNESNIVTNLDRFSKNWKVFDIEKPWTHQDELKGKYWIRTRFSINNAPAFPAMILGLIQGKHRVYLNNKFIGGGDYFRELKQYNFDRSLLILPPAKNEILIEINASERIIPGILLLPNVQPFVGSFSVTDQVRRMVSDRGYHLKRIIYITVALCIAFACFVYFLHHMTNRIYLYFTLILLSGTMALLYGNSTVHESLAFNYHRYLNFQSLLLFSGLLFTTFLSVSKQKFLELANNILIILGSLIAALLFLGKANNPSALATIHQNSFSATAIYTGFWLVCASYILLIQLHQRLTRQVPGLGRFDYQVVLIASGFLTAITNFSATWTGFTFLSLTREMQGFLAELGIAFPLVFSIGIGFVMTIESSQQAKQIRYRANSDELALKILRIIHLETNLHKALADIQTLVCNFIHARRSSLYLVESKDVSHPSATKLLKLQHAIGSEEQIASVREVITETDGLIGSVLSSKSPILVRDFSKEPKFQKLLKEKTTSRTYSSRSCILVPLIVQQELKGILTVADKQNDSAFNEEDFFILNKFAKDLALIIHHALEKESRLFDLKNLEKTLESEKKEDTA